MSNIDEQNPSGGIGDNYTPTQFFSILITLINLILSA